MPMENYSRYQQSVIKNFYKNRDAVSLQRAQELLTELYLAEGKKKEKVWESLFTNLERMGVPADQIEHLRKVRNPELVAKLIEQKL
ncbi:MAG: hypothetical protein RLZZ396_1723 [Planctomycetota bacterium]|jgi:hypothetical protein